MTVLNSIQFNSIVVVTGVLASSPNYPSNYPNNVNRTDSLQVESGKLLRMEFSSFYIQYSFKCKYDYIKITDADGTILMDRSCGRSHPGASSDFFLPPIITTLTNSVNVLFHTDRFSQYPGWKLNWTSVTPGLKPNTLAS